MHWSLGPRFWVLALLSTSLCAVGQNRGEPQQPTSACPALPATLRAMRDCYRALLVFGPALNNPQMAAQLNQLKAGIGDMKSRALLYVPIVPEGHNQPIVGTKVPTARLSEDELAAMRHRFKVEPGDFLVILIGKDGEEKLNSATPVTMDRLKRLIDSMPMRKSEMQQQTPGER
jgi:hypothetical protein